LAAAVVTAGLGTTDWANAGAVVSTNATTARRALRTTERVKAAQWYHRDPAQQACFASARTSRNSRVPLDDLTSARVKTAEKPAVPGFNCSNQGVKLLLALSKED